MQTMARRSSGTKGYTGYRGRRRGRGVLAVVLVVILLLACGFLFAQRYMVWRRSNSLLRLVSPGYGRGLDFFL